jgi:NADH-quinone oxidoreductase subunit L
MIVSVIIYTYKRYAYTNKIESESETNIVAKKFYIDEVYTLLIVKPLEYMSEFFDKKISSYLIDGTINYLALSYLKIGKFVSYIENGNIRFYALYMLIGVMMGFVYLYLLLRAVL